MRCVAFLLTISASCAASRVDNIVYTRDIDLVHELRITNIPAGGRVVHVIGDTPRTLAAKVHGETVVAFAYRATEHVTNGESQQLRENRAQTIVIHAPGYLPRMYEVSVPATARLDVELARPTLASTDLPAAAAPALDAMLERVLAGACDNARVLRTDTEKHLGKDRVSELLGACRPASPFSAPAATWDPTSVPVPASLMSTPSAMLSALRTELDSAQDQTGLAALAALEEAITTGKLTRAAKLASLIAHPLAGTAAALALQLPTALLAARHLAEADVVAHTDLRAALAIATAARHVDPLAGSAGFEKIRAARIAALAEKANAVESRSALAAQMYFLAIDGLSRGDATARDGLAKTEASARAEIGIDLAVLIAGSTNPAVTSSIARAMPSHVKIVDAAANADAILSIAVDEPTREHSVSKQTRTTRVAIGTVRRPNPDHALARDEVERAERSLESAQETYDEVHAQVQEMARNTKTTNGWAVAAVAVTGGVGETVALKALRDAERSLDNARDKLARTPHTVTETLYETAQYPVLHLESTASVGTRFRLEGFGATVFDEATATIRQTSEHVLGDPALDIDEGQAPDVAALARLEPDVVASIDAVAARLGKHVLASEIENAWNAFSAARGEGDIEAAGLLGAAYLLISGDTSKRRTEIIELLAGALP